MHDAIKDDTDADEENEETKDIKMEMKENADSKHLVAKESHAQVTSRKNVLICST